MENNTLQHHGILGQKWGIRRYQNKDGSLTNAGKKRRDRYERAADAGPNNREDHNKAHNKSKSVEPMSDAELRARINRLQLEQQYAALSSKEVKTGKDYVDTIVKASTTVAAFTSTVLTIDNNIDKIKKIVDNKMKKIANKMNN